jgi:hypothetical protein
MLDRQSFISVAAAHIKLELRLLLFPVKDRDTSVVSLPGHNAGFYIGSGQSYSGSIRDPHIGTRAAALRIRGLCAGSRDEKEDKYPNLLHMYSSWGNFLEAGRRKLVVPAGG